MESNVSIIVPFYNEEENVLDVLSELKNICPQAEIIAIDDGSSDTTWEKLYTFPGIKTFRFKTNCGQSAAIYYGLQKATRDYCVLIDGDGQNDPSDIPKLLSVAKKYDLVCGYRLKRKDSAWKRFGSRVANFVRHLFFDDGVRDTGCSLKIFKREHIHYLPPFRSLHRFIPVIFKSHELTITEVSVNHRPRLKGTSKYGNFSRAMQGIYDLIGVQWLLKRKIRFDSIDNKQ